MTNNQDIGAMLKKLAKTPGITYDPKTGRILADHTATTNGKNKMYSVQESAELLTHLQGVCHAKKDLVAEPVARTLPTRPKKVFVCPKKGDESEWFCDIHEDDPLQHDGDGGYYCYHCDHSRVCHGCDDVMEECEIYHINVRRSEFYCEECFLAMTEWHNEKDFYA